MAAVNAKTSGGAGSLNWSHLRGQLCCSRPAIAAIVNLTPDSFSDGGKWLGEAGLPSLANMMAQSVADGATILDIGAESTRPGSIEVAPSEEVERLRPCIDLLRTLPSHVVRSLDTRRAVVARFGLTNGFDVINDVSGLAEPEMADTIAETGAGVIIGHMRGKPSTMLEFVDFEDVIHEVCAELYLSVEKARRAGVLKEAIVVDPGLGFGKHHDQSAALLLAGNFLERELGVPVMIGASRKRFLGHAIGRDSTQERAVASAVAALLAYQAGAALVRVHDVRDTVDAIRTWDFARESASDRNARMA